MSLRKVVFIIGPGHCGSTLIDLILGSHSTAFSLGELRALNRKIKGESFPEGICAICGPRCEFWDTKASLQILRSYFANRFGVQRFYKYLTTNLYQHLFEWTGKGILIDSSKNLRWIRRHVEPFWFWRHMDPVLLYIYRDGRAVVNSYLRKYPQRGVEAVTREWKARTMAMQCFYDSFTAGDRIKVSYEELAQSPGVVISEVCRKLGIPYEPAMLTYWVHPHHIVYGNARARSLIIKYRAQTSSNPLRNVLTARAEQPFYSQIGLSIQPDLRWQEELSESQLKVFEELAGNLNRDFNG